MIPRVGLGDDDDHNLEISYLFQVMLLVDYSQAGDFWSYAAFFGPSEQPLGARPAPREWLEGLVRRPRPQRLFRLTAAAGS